MASLSTSELKKSVAAILRGADLNTLSSKKVRKKLEEQYDADFSERKEEIDKLVMDMITAEENDQKSDSEDEKNSDRESSQNSESEEEVEPPPKKSKPATKKKRKTAAKNDVVTRNEIASDRSEDDADVDDEALARKLQEEERNSRSRAVKKNATKRYSNKKASESGDKPKTRKAGGTYTRKCVLSADLASVVGANEMARPDVVKKMWAIVRERNLLDPRNKQFALCDEQLQKVFGARRVRMFGMMKHLKNHIQDKR